MIVKPDFYINGGWIAPRAPQSHEVINPASEEPVARISMGSAADVDAAVAAAKAALPDWSQSTRESRIALVKGILAQYTARADRKSVV